MVLTLGAVVRQAERGKRKSNTRIRMIEARTHRHKGAKFVNILVRFTSKKKKVFLFVLPMEQWLPFTSKRTIDGPMTTKASEYMINREKHQIDELLTDKNLL